MVQIGPLIVKAVYAKTMGHFGAVDKRVDFTPSSQLYGIIRKTGEV